jgi:hypothetical protein
MVMARQVSSGNDTAAASVRSSGIRSRCTTRRRYHSKCDPRPVCGVSKRYETSLDCSCSIACGSTSWSAEAAVPRGLLAARKSAVAPTSLAATTHPGPSSAEAVEPRRLWPALDVGRMEYMEAGRAAQKRPLKSFRGSVGLRCAMAQDVRSPARKSRSGTISAMPTIRPNGAIRPICSERAS